MCYLSVFFFYFLVIFMGKEVLEMEGKRDEEVVMIGDSEI